MRRRTIFSTKDRRPFLGAGNNSTASEWILICLNTQRSRDAVAATLG
jgi:hypothetical protein